jgi:DNA-binding transcriptional LysR family regulator
MDQLKAMEGFVAVCDDGGFSAAARRLRLAPSSLTRTIAQLEDHLGVRLFTRTTRLVVPTAAGLRFYERARRILSEVDEAERSAQAEQAEPVGRLVVSAPATFGRMHVAGLVSRYLARFPKVSVELHLTDRYVDLVEERVDVAVRIQELADSSLIARRVGWTRRMFAASPAYLARMGEPHTTRELADHLLVGFIKGDTVQHGSASIDWRLRGPDGEECVRFQPRFVTDSDDAAVAHVVAGGGIRFSPSYETIDRVRRGELREVLGSYAQPALPINLVHSSARLPTAALRAFIDEVAEESSWDFR